MLQRELPPADRARHADPKAGRRRTATQAPVNRCNNPSRRSCESARAIHAGLLPPAGSLNLDNLEEPRVQSEHGAWRDYSIPVGMIWDGLLLRRSEPLRRRYNSEKRFALAVIE